MTKDLFTTANTASTAKKHDMRTTNQLLSFAMSAVLAVVIFF